MNTIERNQWIDAFKTISMMGVILIHVHPFSNFNPLDRTLSEAIINQLSRFSVPFFFIASGYLWAGKLSQNAYVLRDLMQRIKKLGSIYVIWCGLYLLLSMDANSIMAHGYLKVTYWKFYEVWKSPLSAALLGTKTHLWFLPALMLGQILVYCLFKYLRKAFIFQAGVVFLIGILGASYQTSPMGLPWPVVPLGGVFCAVFFLSIGISLKLNTFTKNIPLSISLIIIGASGQLFEAWLLWQKFEVDPTTVDFVFSTIPFAIGVFMLALSLQPQPSLSLVKCGQCTLGIYLVHMLFVELMRPIGVLQYLWFYALSTPILVYCFSLWIVRLTQKAKCMKVVWG